MASHPLILTKDEITLFLKLSKGLREGWVTEEETLPIDDTMRKFSIRVALMHLVDPRFKEFQGKIKNAKTEKDAVAALRDVDFSTVDTHDIQEILFAMGPVLMGHMLEEYLKITKDDGMVKQVAALSLIRHSILVTQAKPAKKK
ncbi:hypothetical protein COU80_00940 [Candidatus Peregrinibacteria bacterium CG10_big_fil_rev_8_21_14_0_10_55_24]|nr:MAG: hypothetical protein COU80_00940 [Candidatus Peregrinibacteria bacterium CG10_big_fil_rev_8_21_14_0_10_55_24]